MNQPAATVYTSRQEELSQFLTQFRNRVYADVINLVGNLPVTFPRPVEMEMGHEYFSLFEGIDANGQFVELVEDGHQPATYSHEDFPGDQLLRVLKALDV